MWCPYKCVELLKICEQQKDCSNSFLFSLFSNDKSIVNSKETKPED